jgi:hypothetical protein
VTGILYENSTKTSAHSGPFVSALKYLHLPPPLHASLQPVTDLFRMQQILGSVWVKDRRSPPRLNWVLPSHRTVWPLKMGPIGGLETSGSDYHTPRNNPEDGRTVFECSFPSQGKILTLRCRSLCTVRSWMRLALLQTSLYSGRQLEFKPTSVIEVSVCEQTLIPREKLKPVVPACTRLKDEELPVFPVGSSSAIADSLGGCRNWKSTARHVIPEVV